MRTILIVDDDAWVRGLVRDVLAGDGYRVLEAGDGQDAIRVAAEHPGPIHLLLTDVVMPGMNGQALAERLKSIRPETKVLYVSGYTDEAIFRQGVRPEANNFLHKPYTKDGLISKLQQVLELSA